MAPSRHHCPPRVPLSIPSLNENNNKRQDPLGILPCEGVASIKTFLIQVKFSLTNTSFMNELCSYLEKIDLCSIGPSPYFLYMLL
ncbi:hypothetical protein KIS4809_3188 [Bacillus sp. ZZV12-4809]|nr:hypothetical protein KIS4809_3188 [Bacillus sp. ZZV12-4809]